MMKIILVCCTPLLAAAAVPALAHKASDSYLELLIEPSGIKGRWDIALRDLDYAIGLDGDGNGELTWGEVRRRHDAIAAYALARLELRRGGTACTISLAAPQLVTHHSDGAYTVLPLAIDCPTTATRLQLDYRLLFDLDPLHRGLLALEHGGVTTTAVFSPDGSRLDFDLGAMDAWAAIPAFLVEGVWHIWTGYDHILFLIALLLPSVLRREAGSWHPVTGFRRALLRVVTVVTAFTLAHSITLGLASFQVIGLPSRLVESVIAASIVVAALNNIRPLISRHLWSLAFVFGLLHGFGFAGVLQDLLGSRQAVLPALLGFNLGVELGQVVIVTAVFPLIYGLRTLRFYHRTALPAGSLAIALLASSWFLERAFDLRPGALWRAEAVSPYEQKTDLMA